jgi:hypothetical protein
MKCIMCDKEIKKEDLTKSKDHNYRHSDDPIMLPLLLIIFVVCMVLLPPLGVYLISIGIPVSIVGIGLIGVTICMIMLFIMMLKCMMFDTYS